MMSKPASETNAAKPEFHAYPPDVTFHDLIRHNKRNTWLLVAGMGVLVVVVFQVIAMAIMAYSGGGGGYSGGGGIDAATGQSVPLFSWQGVLLAGAAAVAVTILAGTWSYYGGAKTLLSISGARKINKADDPPLFNVVEEMSLAAGLPMPDLYVIDSAALNAFATGRDPSHAAVAITTGLRQKLTRDELQAVMAHEIAHVRHYDIRLTLMVATMVGLIVLACDVFLRMAFYAPRRRGRGDGKGNAAAVVLMVIAILLAILAPVLAALIQFTISRQREYLADAGAVELTRNPKGMADALRRLAGDHTPLESANRATAHMYIVNPILNAKDKQELNSVFATHPPVSKRIARVEALLR